MTYAANGLHEKIQKKTLKIGAQSLRPSYSHVRICRKKFKKKTLKNMARKVFEPTT
jgi:hypothetical protein